ncbi:hypothetical protein [Pseudarthrobacter polychromogenes]|uniref:hypothetical protein n=1 Tax=Pseudarthrobacter polychromogenes TaxID=1676 RepID=UPI001667502E|nr:hypothetical protein [Pseudarthrobacter polychromogenes]
MSEDDPITPADLARELGKNPKRIRDYLRDQYGTLPPDETRWFPTPEQVADVRRHFGA